MNVKISQPCPAMGNVSTHALLLSWFYALLQLAGRFYQLINSMKHKTISVHDFSCNDCQIFPALCLTSIICVLSEPGTSILGAISEYKA
jgi:hypothetical protein